MRPTLFFLFSFVFSCRTSVPDLVRLENANTTTFTISVEEDGGFSAKLKNELLTQMRNDLLQNGIGVPVLDGNPSQLLLVVKMLEWRYNDRPQVFSWKVLDAKGKVLKSGIHEDVLGSPGFTSDKISGLVLHQVSEMNLQAFSKNTSFVFPTDNVVMVTEEAEERAPRNFVKTKNDGKKDYAIVIGVEKYRNEISSALFAENDARDVAMLFQQSFNIPQENMRVLINERASKSDILSAVFDWLPEKATEKDARVFIYFSGHGSPKIENGEAFLMPYDSDPTYLKSGGISISKIIEGLSRLKSDRLHLILDTCFSGNGDRSTLAKGTRPLVPIQDFQPGAVTLMAASAASQTSGVHKKAKNGLFTYYFLEAFEKETDENKDHDISLFEIDTYVSKKVARDARQQNREQNATFSTTHKESKNYVILKGL